MLSGAALGALVLMLGPPSPAKDDANEADRGWVQLTPGSISLPGPGDTRDLRVFDTAVDAGYRWALAGGLIIEPLEHLLVGATASVEQNIWVFDNDAPSYQLCFADGCWGWRERGVGYLVRFGGDLRVGFRYQRLMSYAMLSPQIAFSHMRLDCDNSVEQQCFTRETDVGPSLGGGGGVAVRVAGGLSVGVEASVDHAWLDTRDDPFEAIRTWDLALVGIIRF